jgi:hypothetical protein
MVRIMQKGVELVSRMRKEISSDLANMLSHMDQEEADTVDATRRAMEYLPARA